MINMIFSRKGALSAVIWALLISLAAPTVLHAHGGGPVYEKRHVYMNELGDYMKAFGNFVKRGKGDLNELREMAARIVEQAPELPSHFPPNTGMGDNPESQAKPDIWTSWDEFVAAADRLADHARAAEAAFASEDSSEIGSAVRRLGEEGCRGCHQQFREKKN